MRRFITAVVALAATAFMPAGLAYAADPEPEPSAIDTSLVELARVPSGAILDANATRMLYLDYDDTLTMKVRNLGTGVVTRVPQASDRSPDTGWLTSRGAVYSARNQNFPYEAHLYEWSGANPLELGTHEDSSVVVHAPYVLWLTGSTLYRRNLDTDVTVTVATGANNSGYSVAANGDVVYTGANNQVMRYRNGVSQPMTSDGAVHMGPVTDGTNVAYTTVEGDLWSVWLDDGVNHVRLSEPASPYTYPPVNYQVANGWAAFMRQDAAGNGQIWLRSPAGIITQQSDVGGTQATGYVQLIGLSPAGQTVYSVNERLYLAASGQTTIVLAYGRSYFYHHQFTTVADFADYRDGRWFVSSQGSLFAQNDQAPVALSVSVEGNGTVAVGPYGKQCRATCEFPLPPSAPLTISVTADRPGWLFDGWTGACADSGAVCHVTLAAASSVHARFIPGDTEPPVTTGPTVTLPAGAQLSSTVPAEVPMVVSWTAVDADGQVASIDVEVSVNYGYFGPVPLPTSTALQARLIGVPTNHYALRVRATDNKGNVGDWTYGDEFTLGALRATEAMLTGDWTTTEAPTAWFGAVTSTSAASASAALAGYSRTVGVVASTGPGYGDLDIYVDDQRVQTVHTASAAVNTRQIVAVLSLDCGCHTVRITHPASGPVGLEGFLVLS